QRRQYEEARTYFFQGEKLFEQLPKTKEGTRQKGDLYGNLALNYQAEGANDSALFYFAQASTFFQEIGSQARMAVVYQNIGLIHEKQFQIDSAHLYFTKAYGLVSANAPQSQDAAQFGLNYGNSFTELGQYRRARQLLDQSYAIVQAKPSKFLRRLAYKKYANLEGKVGNYQAAYRWGERYRLLNDSILNETSLKELTEVQEKYEREKRENQIRILEKDTEIQALALQQTRTRLQLVLAAGLALLILGGLLYYRNRLQQQRALNQERMKQQEVKIQAIVETQESERARISRDLHDGIAQLLSATRMNFDRLQQDDPSYQKALSMLDEACEEVRGIAYQMMPRTLEEQGLEVALEELMKRSFQGTEIHAQFEVLGKMSRFPQQVEINLFRIVQELINNTRKHASATEVDCLLRQTDKMLTLTFEDNGKGFDADKSELGLGITNLHTRAEAIGGSLHFDSSPESGTLVICRLGTPSK
ncbi:MAG: sensor histidine kinase, partial [Bacteroidota bacterium]